MFITEKQPQNPKNDKTGCDGQFRSLNMFFSKMVITIFVWFAKLCELFWKHKNKGIELITPPEFYQLSDIDKTIAKNVLDYLKYPKSTNQAYSVQFREC